MSYNDDEEIKVDELGDDVELDDDLGEPLDDDLEEDDFAGLDGSAEY